MGDRLLLAPLKSFVLRFAAHLGFGRPQENDLPTPLIDQQQRLVTITYLDDGGASIAIGGCVLALSGAEFGALQAAIAPSPNKGADQEDDDLPMFARGIAGPLGKLEVTVKTKIDEKTQELWLQECAMQGVDTSSELRDFIYLRVYGKTYRQMCLEKANHDAKRTATLAGLIGHSWGPESDKR